MEKRPGRLLLLLPTATYRADDFLAAAREVGVPVTVASEHPASLAAAAPGGTAVIDFRDPPRALEQARALHAEAPFAAVVGADDVTVMAAAVIAAGLGLRGNPPDAVAAARSKPATRRALQRAGLLYPRFRHLSLDEPPEPAAAEVPYPCVLKPLALSGSQGVIRADGPPEFIQAFARIREIAAGAEAPGMPGEVRRGLLVEDFIPGVEVALEGLLIDGRLHTLCLFDKPDPLDGPYFEETLYVTPSRLPAEAQEAVRATAAAAAAALGLRDGPVHVELRLNERGAWVLEVNPRSIGGKCSRALRLAGGVSLEELILRRALGLPLPPMERERAASGVMMIPVPARGVLERVEGPEAARAVPGIVELTLTCHPGQVLVPLPESAVYPGFLFARGDTPEAVEAALREAHARLRLVVRPA